MNLPKELVKYKGFIESLGEKNINSRNYNRVSKFLLRQILDSKDGKLLLRMKTGLDKFDFYMPEMSDIPNCFVKRVWDFSSFEDKIKIIDKYLEYLFENDTNKKPNLRIISNPLDSVDNDNLANYNIHSNEVFLNLDKLEEYPGLSVMSIIFHECTHAKDMTNIEGNIIPQILQNYTTLEDESTYHPALFEKLIMDMPIEGYLFNKKSDNRDLVQGKIQNDILKCKNFFSIFNESSIIDPNVVSSKADFEKYVNSMLYFYSPLERFARISVRNFFRTQISDDRLIMEEDKKNAQSIVDNETYIDGYLDTFKQVLVESRRDNGGHTITTMKDLFDKASQYQYYCKKQIFGRTNEEKFPTQAKLVKNKYKNLLNELYSNFVWLKQHGAFVGSSGSSPMVEDLEM